MSDERAMKIAQVAIEYGSRKAKAMLRICGTDVAVALRRARALGMELPPPRPRSMTPNAVRKRRRADRVRHARQQAKLTAYQPPRFIDEHLAIELLCRALPRRGTAA